MTEMIWNAQAVSRALGEIAAIRGHLLLELKRLLDEFNHWNQSAHYYDILAGDWLERFAHLTYAGMVEGAALDGCQGLKIIPVAADISAFDRMSTLPSGLHEYFREAVSHLLAGGTPSAWSFSAASVQIANGGQPSLAEKVVSALSTRRPEVLLVNPYFKCGRVKTATTLIGWRNLAALDSLQYQVKFVSRLDVQWRLKRACEVLPAKDFLGVLKVLLPLHLPVALLEGFATYRNTVLVMPVARPKVVYSANALHSHMTFKLLVAEWRKHGTRLLYHQHGGGYGMDRIHTLEEYESRVSDRYYTWGWQTADNPKVRPLSPAALHAPSHKRRYILLNCTNFPTVVYRIHFHPMPGTIQKFNQETCAFLSTLRNYENLLVRPDQNDYSGNSVRMMQQAAPEAAFDDRSETSFQRFARSRLVVHNYLCTGYLETMALNIPTVCFYDSNAYAFRAEAEPFVSELESVGILHRSGIAAARFVNSVRNDPEGWWHSPEVQNVRMNFVRQYANFSPNWREQWEEEFLAVLASAH